MKQSYFFTCILILSSTAVIGQFPKKTVVNNEVFKITKLTNNLEYDTLILGNNSYIEIASDIGDINLKAKHVYILGKTIIYYKDSLRWPNHIPYTLNAPSEVDGRKGWNGQAAESSPTINLTFFTIEKMGQLIVIGRGKQGEAGYPGENGGIGHCQVYCKNDKPTHGMNGGDGGDGGSGGSSADINITYSTRLDFQVIIDSSDADIMQRHGFVNKYFILYRKAPWFEENPSSTTWGNIPKDKFADPLRDIDFTYSYDKDTLTFQFPGRAVYLDSLCLYDSLYYEYFVLKHVNKSDSVTFEILSSWHNQIVKNGDVKIDTVGRNRLIFPPFQLYMTTNTRQEIYRVYRIPPVTFFNQEERIGIYIYNAGGMGGLGGFYGLGGPGGTGISGSFKGLCDNGNGNPGQNGSIGKPGPRGISNTPNINRVQ
jgi:hypothetical protein